MRCVILIQSFYPEETAAGALLTDLAEGLVARGMEVKAVCGQPSYYGRGRVPSRLEHRGVTIHRPPCTWFRKDSLPGRAVNVATYLAGTLAHLLVRRERGPLLVVTSPPLLGLVAYLAKRLLGARYACLIYDVYPDILIQCGLASQRGLPARLWRALNRRVLRAADRIVVIGRDMDDVIRRSTETDRAEGEAHALDLISNWADAQSIRPQEKEKSSFFRDTGIEGKFVLMYSGNFGRLHNVSMLVEAMDRLRGEDIQLLLVGDGYGRPDAERSIEEKDLRTVSVYPYQPRSRLGDSLTACDVQVALLGARFTGLAVPSKLYGMLASGKPLLVVCEQSSEMGRVVTEESCGIVVEPEDLDGLVDAIRFLRNHPDECAAMGHRARSAFEAKYTREQAVRQYTKLLTELQEESVSSPPTPGAE